MPSEYCSFTYQNILSKKIKFYDQKTLNNNKQKLLEECWKDKKRLKKKNNASYFENIDLFKETDLDSLFGEDHVFGQESI